MAQEERRVAASHYQHQERRRADPTVGSAFSRNPPAKAKRNAPGAWFKHSTGMFKGQYSLFGTDPEGGIGHAHIIPYTPNSGAQATKEDARHFAGVYERQQGRKLPKGTKYLLVNQTAGKTTAHKTLVAAKAAGAKALGIKAKPRKNPAKGAAFKVKVRSAPKAKAQLVSLPSSAKAQRVGKYVIHRAVTYRGAKMKLLKGWTISTPKGLAVAKYKTKAAAVKAASK